MAEYIKKWPVVDKLTTLENELQQYKPFRPCEATMYRRICDVEIEIGKMDAEDVAPVVHGRWEKWNGDDRHHCTVCECYANAERDSYGYIAYEFLDNYCPNCGAKMDLEEQNGKSKNDRLFQASNAE